MKENAFNPMQRILFAAMSAFFFASVESAEAKTYRCDIVSKQFCTASGCQPSQLGLFNLIDGDRKTYSRCDSMGCDTYDSQFSASGIFINIAVPGRGVIAQLNNSDGTFMEVVTQAGNAYISFGACK